MHDTYRLCHWHAFLSVSGWTGKAEAEYDDGVVRVYAFANCSPSRPCDMRRPSNTAANARQA